MYVITGNTFEHRETLKEFGGRWNSAKKRWEIDRLNASELTRARALVGCVVVEEKDDGWKIFTSPDDNEDDDEDESDNEPLRILGLADLADAEDGQIDGGFKTRIYGDDETYLNYFKDINPKSFFGFSSFAKLLEYIDQIPGDKRIGDRNAGWVTKTPVWHGSDSMQDALNIAAKGWPEGIDNAATVLEALSVEHAIQRRRKHSLAGGNVSVGRLLSGNPVHMTSRPKQPGRKVVTLFMAGGNHAGIKAANMIVRAAIIAAIADILEREGYSCEIVNIWTANGSIFNGKPYVQIAVTLKHAGEKLNMPDLVFALGHPSYLRRFMFACVSSADELSGIYHNQGYPSDAFNSAYKPAKNEFYIPKLSSNFAGSSLVEIALNMLPRIEPLNLPVKIRKENG